MITVVDVGATKTLVGQFKNGLPTDTTRFPTPTKADDFLETLIEHLAQLKHITTISIGVPGLVSDNGTLIRCGNLPWKSVPIRQTLVKRFKVPVFIENDAKLAGLAEVSLLAKKPRVGLYITVSTGIGVGVVVEGRLLRPMHFSEAGHMMLYHDGHYRVWQDFASGSAINEHFGKQVHDFTTMEEWDEVAMRLAPGLLALIPAFQPEVIIFGGGVGGFFKNFRATLEHQIKKHLTPYIDMPELRVAVHANEAVLYGCYYHAKYQRSK